MAAEAELNMSYHLPKQQISSGGDHDDNDAFDPSAPPPFTISQIRAAIPGHCWVKNPWRSLAYFLRDVFLVLSLLALALHFDSWFFWPLYWPLQGTMIWALFVLGHDCGHGSFSNSSMLNSFVGHISHCVILIPFHGWRLSHKIHHQNHGHVENDESWVPLTEKLYKSLDPMIKMLNFTLPFQLFTFPIYLWVRTPGKKGSHFNPYSQLFSPQDRKDVTTSTLCWLAMVSLLLYLSLTMGPTRIFKLYGVPYLISVMWLAAVTYLQHHGYKQKLPWYRGKEWSYLRGGLTTLDRDYGWINNIHHNTGTHLIHHLFPQIPHYHLIEATKAARPVLGKYYHEPEKSGPLPVHLIRDLIDSLRQDRFVSDSGDIVFYQTDVDLYDSLKPSLSYFIFLWKKK